MKPQIKKVAGDECYIAPDTYGPDNDQLARWMVVAPKGYLLDDGYDRRRAYFWTKKEAADHARRGVIKTDDPFYN